MKYFLTFAIQSCTVAAILAVYLGMAWITEGRGLHPVLAGALSFALIVIPYWLHPEISPTHNHKEL